MQAKQSDAAKDISYAHSAETRSGRAMIRLMENSTGRLRLIRRARGYEQEVASGRGFFDVMAERYGLTLEIATGTLDAFPREGPLIVIANHPYGILDGLMMGYILGKIRDDFCILANSVFRKSEDINRVILPISFDKTRRAIEQNITTRKVALDYLAQGGVIGVFPGGTVSTGTKPFAKPMDPGWRSFTARMIQQSQATVVPLYFHGHTSRLFQIASHLHVNLRLGLLINEFGTRVDQPVRISVGDRIDPDALATFGKDSKAMMDFLRKSTYELSPSPVNAYDLGYEFEQRHRS